MSTRGTRKYNRKPNVQIDRDKQDTAARIAQTTEKDQGLQLFSNGCPKKNIFEIWGPLIEM